MRSYEMNFDGLVGPTHNYSGLSVGNIASRNNASAESNPKQAALEGLAKMKTLADMGLKQGVLAPQERPNIYMLRQLGFSGDEAKVMRDAYQQAPSVFLSCCSASSMWTANAATVSPSADTADNKVHFTPANLTNKFHRATEPEITSRVLKATFADTSRFVHHAPLPFNEHFGDEGAANHTRLCANHSHSGVELFVYGRHAFDESKVSPKVFPARQTFEASQAISRLHGLAPDNAVFIQQNPDLIDQGVFHNDVIAVGNENVLFFHEQAFLDTDLKLAEIKQKLRTDSLHYICVKSSEVSVENAIKSYLFNTQIVTLPSGEMAIIAPTECQENEQVNRYLTALVQQNTPIKHVHYLNVKQSMKNGGGPACLRLRVTLNENELNAVNPSTVINQLQYDRLTTWVNKHYRDKLTENDLCDPLLLNEVRTALDELTKILNLGSIYTFQQN